MYAKDLAVGFALVVVRVHVDDEKNPGSCARALAARHARGAAWSNSPRRRACAPRCGPCPWAPSPWLLALTRVLPRTRSPARIAPGQAALNDDEDIFAAPNDVELFQSQPPVADAFAGLQLVFITVPRADEMNLVGERLPLIGAVRRDHVDHAVDHEPLAGRAAGMDASVAVGEVGAVLVEHADFGVSSNDDAPIAVLHLGRLGNEAFRHGHSSRSL